MTTFADLVGVKYIPMGHHVLYLCDDMKYDSSINNISRKIW